MSEHGAFQERAIPRQLRYEAYGEVQSETDRLLARGARYVQEHGAEYLNILHAWGPKNSFIFVADGVHSRTQARVTRVFVTGDESQQAAISYEFDSHGDLRSSVSLDFRGTDMEEMVELEVEEARARGKFGAAFDRLSGQSNQVVTRERALRLASFLRFAVPVERVGRSHDTPEVSAEAAKMLSLAVGATLATHADFAYTQDIKGRPGERTTSLVMEPPGSPSVVRMRRGVRGALLDGVPEWLGPLPLDTYLSVGFESPTASELVVFTGPEGIYTTNYEPSQIPLFEFMSYIELLLSSRPVLETDAFLARKRDELAAYMIQHGFNPGGDSQV